MHKVNDSDIYMNSGTPFSGGLDILSDCLNDPLNKSTPPTAGQSVICTVPQGTEETENGTKTESNSMSKER